MKNIYKIYCFIIFSTLVVSCGDEFLDTPPKSFLTTDTFYENMDNVELGIAGAYTSINTKWTNFSSDYYEILNAGTDEAVLKNVTDANRTFAYASYTGEERELLSSWSEWYRGINAINFLLREIDNVSTDNLTEVERKAEVIAEARFLRGIYHMYLAKMFGGIPVNTTAPADDRQPRQTLEVVYTQVLEDLQYAYENLNEVSSVVGRASKWTAAAYLGQTYCYLGSCKKFGVGGDLELNSFDWVDEDEAYEKALTVLNDVDENSGYVLIDEYDRLFRATTASDQRRECLFMAEANDNITGNNVNDWFVSLVPRGNRNRGGGPIPRGNGPTSELYFKYTDGDIRRDHNLTKQLGSLSEEIDGITYYIPNPIDNLNQLNNRDYCGAKFRVQTSEDKNLPDAFMTEGNTPLIRFADVLLLKAEAMYFANNDEVGARALISRVRLRAAGNDTAVRDALDAEYETKAGGDFVQELLDERSRELCFETHRRYDLIRFNRHTIEIEKLAVGTGYFNTELALDPLKTNWGNNGNTLIWFPIPRQQTIVNNNLINNLGYSY